MKGLFEKKCQTEYFDTIINYSPEELGNCIVKNINATITPDATPVILCIGTDRATGDCLGPLVGEQMLNYNANYKVLGCLHSPVHALNLRETIHTIYTKIDNPYVIAIDASLGDSAHVGYITVSNCPISPGKGVNKKLPAIGDISITGIVNVTGQSAYLLQSTRLHIVKELSDHIANALKYAIDYLEDF